jgi:hypothetical protein
METDNKNNTLNELELLLDPIQDDQAKYYWLAKEKLKQGVEVLINRSKIQSVYDQFPEMTIFGYPFKDGKYHIIDTTRPYTFAKGLAPLFYGDIVEYQISIMGIPIVKIQNYKTKEDIGYSSHNCTIYFLNKIINKKFEIKTVLEKLFGLLWFPLLRMKITLKEDGDDRFEFEHNEIEINQIQYLNDEFLRMISKRKECLDILPVSKFINVQQSIIVNSDIWGTRECGDIREIIDSFACTKFDILTSEQIKDRINDIISENKQAIETFRMYKK